MTPFESWYAINVAAWLPADYPKKAAENGRKLMAQCWNEALDAALKVKLPASIEDYVSHIYSLRVKA